MPTSPSLPTSTPTSPTTPSVSRCLFYQAANELTRFAYDSDYARYYQWAKLANGDTQETFYIGASYEERITHHAGGGTRTVQYAYVNDAVLQVTDASATPITQTRYLLRNALHSVEAVLNDQGQLLERLSYDTWGKPDATPQYTTRSYTGQEYLPRLQLIHLNGRVYDPSLGRFLSADPLVQAPDFSQSYNRYSYVWNNPVSAWDPSGYEAVPIADQDMRMYGIAQQEQFFLYSLEDLLGVDSASSGFSGYTRLKPDYIQVQEQAASLRLLSPAFKSSKDMNLVPSHAQVTQMGECSALIICVGAGVAREALENPAPGTIASVAGLLLATDNTVLTASGRRVSTLPLYYGMDIESYRRSVAGAKYFSMTGNLLGYGAYSLSTVNYAEAMRNGDYVRARDAAVTGFYGALMLAPPHVVTIPVGLVGLYVTGSD